MKRIFIILCATILYAFILSACTNDTLSVAYEGFDYYSSSTNVDAVESIYTSNTANDKIDYYFSNTSTNATESINVSNTVIDEIDYYPNLINTEITEPIITLISPEDNASFWNNVLVSEGFVSLMGGDEMAWYIMPFGFNFHAISGLYLSLVDDYAVWTRQFHDGRRDIREFGKRTFIEDFGISKEELIQAAEAGYGRPMHEIDALVNWARYYFYNDITPRSQPPYSTDASVLFWAVYRFSLNDWYALFSNDVETVWNAFPGGGVFYNGRVYSAEWIMQNMDRAIHEEGIPFYEIESVFQRIDESFLAGMTEAIAAQSTFNATMAAMQANVNE